MKIRFHRKGHNLTVTIECTRHSGLAVYTCWRERDQLHNIFHGVAHPGISVEIKIDLRTIGISHYIKASTANHEYTRYIPSRYLDLGSEHN